MNGRGNHVDGGLKNADKPHERISCTIREFDTGHGTYGTVYRAELSNFNDISTVENVRLLLYGETTDTIQIL